MARTDGIAADATALAAPQPSLANRAFWAFARVFSIVVLIGGSLLQ